MNNVTNMNAEKTPIVRLTKPVSPKNVLTHVRELHVAEEPNVKPNNTEAYVIAREDYKETQSCLAKKLVARQMMTVLEMRNVTSCLVAAPEKNVNLFVLERFVLKEQAVKQQITKKYVPAIIRYKETDTLPALNVSMNFAWFYSIYFFIYLRLKIFFIETYSIAH